MKITELEILRVPPSWVWLRIHTDTELTGLGEPYLEDHPESVIAEVRRLEPLLIDQDPTQPVQPENLVKLNLVSTSVAGDGDGDGVSDATEDGAPGAGDGNSDGIPDSQQPHVASLTGLRGEYITAAIAYF